ncbi:RICIN domain-containing protein [Plantactinospora soyae]|uniref:Pectate lyase n=1 Tax=Plantactinospora soyae TaxID=1544732 RepID=A0A927R3D3_9ACTN|nr:RICIN domain-containing protein [Plantactinospora soyae]MBE1491713.1 pectate lyase [Plantactinospora soyae]
MLPRILRRRRPPTIAAMMVAALAVPVALVVSPTPSQAANVDTGAYYVLASRHSGKAIDVYNLATTDGAPIVQWARNDGNQQQWQFLDVGSGYYQLRSRLSGKALQIASAADGAELTQQAPSGDTRQHFRVVDSPDGYVRLVNRLSGKALDVWEWSSTDGGRISQFADLGGTNQQWQMVRIGGSSGPQVPYSSVPDGFAQGTTGGAGGQTVTVTTQAQLNQYVTASTPYVIRVAGTINISPKGTELRVASNKTIIGVGTSGQIVGGGFFLNTGVSNVIIRNLTIRDTTMADDDPDDDAYDYDAIQLDTANRIWIDHNRLSRMNDGLIDSRKDTTNLTVSWNHLVDNNKTFGIGWTENVTARITIHHNWFQNTRTRNPSADNIAYCHMYNNYLQNSTSYGNYVRGLTKAVIENSYFENVRNPYYVEAGELVNRGNITVNSPWDSGKVTSKGSAFNPSSFYPYTLHPAADIPAMLRTHTGPQASIGN